MSTISQLDNPLTLPCGARLPNRIALAPLTNTQSNSDGTLYEDEFQWLLRRAGHFGLLSTCAAYVSEEGKAWDGQLGIADETHLRGLTRLAAALTEAGSLPIVQLHHAGAKATLAPRKISTAAGEDIHAATAADLARITADFTAAALRAAEAGFAGVEIHGANGYLFTQFLAPEDNPRTDEYGGNLVGRARFLRETVQAVRAAVPADFIVGVRISPVDTWARRGLLLDDAVQLTKWLAEDGIDFLHLSLREASDPAPFEADGRIVVSTIKAALPPAIPLLAAGNIWDRAAAEAAEQNGVDVVVVGRAAIPHPDWPTVSQAKGFTPMHPPWSADYLRSVGLGPDFIQYISRFVG